MVRAAVDLRERGPVPKRERRVGEDSDAAGRTKPSNSWCASAWSAADCVSVWNARVAASGSRTWRAAATSSCRLDWLRCNAGDDLEHLLVANNYAASLKELGRFEEARSLLRKTIPVARRIAPYR